MKIKSLLGVTLVLALLVLGYFLIPKLFKSSEPLEKSVAVLPFEKSIAVLPFINDSPDESNAYFINGIMEEILNNLLMIKELRVLSRTSVENYKKTIKTIPEIAKELGVIYILEGSGQKYGNKIRLNVQLIDAKNNKHLWSESYENEVSEISDIMSVQTQIAKAIATEIKAQIIH
jgi:TolB-like protein